MAGGQQGGGREVRGGSREVTGVCEEEAGERQVVAGRKQGGGRWWLGGSRGRQEVAGSQQGGSAQMGQSSGGHSEDQLCGEELGAVAPAHPQPGRVQGSKLWLKSSGGELASSGYILEIIKFTRPPYRKVRCV